MFSQSNRKRDMLRRGLILVGIVIFSLGCYILLSKLVYRIGFPLDDSWIHQTYARNLALRGEWAFLPGRPSAGSTSPLWTAILAIGFLVHLSPYIWTFLLGGLILWGIAMLVESATRKLCPVYHPYFPWAGALISLEWHLVWSAGSGMETLLCAFLCLAVLVVLLMDKPRWFLAGSLIGLAVWVRPDAITLLGPVFLWIMVSTSGWRSRIRGILNACLGFGGLFALYLFFNLVLAGAPWPNTFYAKQAEYASLLTQPFLVRLAKEPLQLIIGVGFFVLPGAFWMIYRSIRNRHWNYLIVIAWAAGFLILYAWRLPVNYQYGRYIMPVLPIALLLGFIGIFDFLDEMRASKKKLYKTAWMVGVILALLLFWGQGARSYARDVAIIETEMVDTARWVADNLAPDELVAAHDVGALGYYGEHEIVDLAGLISPDVIPFIRDEIHLREYINEMGVDALVTFPDWYGSLTVDKPVLYSSGGVFGPSIGGTNMTVYRWTEP